MLIMRSRIGFFCVTLFLFFGSIANADSELWEELGNTYNQNGGNVQTSSRQVSSQNKSVYRKKIGKHFRFNKRLFETELKEKPQKSGGVSLNASTSRNNLVLALPLPSGNVTEVTLKKNSLITNKLNEINPHLQSFSIVPNREIAGGKVTLSQKGVDAMIQKRSGKVIFIDPVSNNQDNEIYISYEKQAQDHKHGGFICGANKSNFSIQESLGQLSTDRFNQTLATRMQARPQQSLINYKIAVATTGEYTAKHGGTVEGAMAAIATTLNRVNQVLEQDLGIHLTLVENNHLLINTDASSDPFDASTTLDLVIQNQAYIDSIIGNDNYDIGHLFTANGGGLAAIGSACHRFNKAKGVSGIANPVSDSFDLDFVAHEIGHQLGATHTFNSAQGLCSGNTREAITAFEPGSGSTIMSYAGYCGLDNLQSNSDAMYHIGNIEQIRYYTSQDTGADCGQRLNSSNQPPVPNAGQNHVIPSRTPFELTGSAHDADGDDLLFAWEQLDAGDASPENQDKGNNALFRVNMPSDDKGRIFPVLSNVLGDTNTRGETLPESERTMRFSFVAQDGFNPAQSDEMMILVKRTGSRFALNLPRSQYTIGTSYPIYWNVANTDQSPVNCSSVDILLSVNRANSFDILLGDNIPNTGEATIVIPTTTSLTTSGRFKIKCSDNIFFAISSRNFVVTDKTYAVTYQHNDQDQAEENLLDTNSNSNSASNSSSTNTNSETNVSSNNSGGGAFELIFIYLALFGVYIFRKSSFKLNSNDL